LKNFDRVLTIDGVQDVFAMEGLVGLDVRKSISIFSSIFFSSFFLY